MKILRTSLLGVLLSFSAAQAADVLTTAESANLLHRMAFAARVMSYNGIYLYQHADTMETFHVVHLFDTAGEQERRESLDGIPREFVRNNDQIVCYMQDAKPFTLDRRTANKFFPGVMPDQAVDVLANYTFKRTNMDRVAGMDCQNVVLEPNDKLRNLHKLCVDPRSGLLLKSVMYSPDDRSVIEQFAFSQIDFTTPIDKRMLKSAMAGKQAVSPPPQVAVAPASPPAVASNVAWPSANGTVPQGFRLVTQTLSRMPGKPTPVHHYLFSDGMVTVSVFVEPAGNGPITLPSRQGAVNFFSRQLDGWRVTALGEVPLRTVQLFTQAFEVH
jgi:sigma-E factor negative regulatory protein RseB